MSRTCRKESRIELNLELRTQVDTSDFFVTQNRFGVPIGYDTTFIHNTGLFADIECFSDIVVSQKDPDASVFQLIDNGLDVAH